MNVRYLLMTLLFTGCSSAPEPVATTPVTRSDFCPRLIQKVEACIDDPEFRAGLVEGVLKLLEGTDMPPEQVGLIEQNMDEEKESIRGTFLDPQFRAKCPVEMTQGYLPDNHFNAVAPTITEDCRAFGTGIFQMINGTEEFQFSG